jgi:hypothetical protein
VRGVLGSFPLVAAGEGGGESAESRRVLGTDPSRFNRRPKLGAEHYGEERAETAEALAELIMAEELKRGRWQEADLKTRPEGDSGKVILAARWRAETTMTVGWIAERLAMGTRDSLNPLLSHRRKLDGE